MYVKVPLICQKSRTLSNGSFWAQCLPDGFVQSSLEDQEVCARASRISTLVPTYGLERRQHAQWLIRISGSYLRFVWGSDIPEEEEWCSPI